jgi:hypothetical protein
LRLVTWVDANAPYNSHFINMRAPQQPYDLPADQQLLGAIENIHARRCTPCHSAQEVTRADWIDLRSPAQSLFLTAPSALSEAGGKCSAPPYADQLDPDYLTVKRLVEDAVQRAWTAPRRDLRGLLSDSQ